MDRRSPYRAFTLVELLMVIAIIAILIALLFPAVQSAREAARRTQCANNLKQLALALANYESVHGYYPIVRSAGHEHGWIVPILPHLEQQHIADMYDWSVPWNWPKNQPAVKNRIKSLLCPSTPDPSRVALLVNGKEAGVTDYSTPSEVSSTAAIKINRGNKVIRGAIVSYEHASAALIRDGLSNTLMLWEDAGRPNHYVSGRKLGPVEVDTKCENANVTSGFVFGGAWADENNFTPIHGFSADGTSCELGQGTRCPMNCTNNNEAYAFHPQGMVVAFCDGSVRPIHDSITLELMAALITRAGREVVDHESF